MGTKVRKKEKENILNRSLQSEILHYFYKRHSTKIPLAMLLYLKLSLWLGFRSGNV
jgi:hypothetical protein